MLKIVTMTCHDHMSLDKWSDGKEFYIQKIELIKEVNPSLIVVDSSKECAVDFIFKDLFETFTPFLEETDRYIHFITTDTSKNFPSNRYIVEPSYGMLLNFFVTHINQNEAGTRLDKFYPDFHPSTFKKLFTCYNNRSDYHRKALVDLLFKQDLFSHGIITYLNPNQNIVPPYQWQFFSGEKLVDDHGFTPDNSNFLAQNYMTGMIDIVTESRYRANELFVTEKTFKPIFAFKPFLVLGAPYFHKHLKEKYGLEMYEEFFDYSFDSLSDVNDRIEGIIKNLNILKSFNERDLHDLYIKTIPKMVNNKFRLAEICLDKYRIIPKCLQVVFNNPYEVHGPDGEIIGYIKKNKW